MDLVFEMCCFVALGGFWFCVWCGWCFVWVGLGVGLGFGWVWGWFCVGVVCLVVCWVFVFGCVLLNVCVVCLGWGDFWVGFWDWLSVGLGGFWCLYGRWVGLI